MSGSVTPTTGSVPLTMPMLMTTCQNIIAATPTQTVAPKRSRASPAIFRIHRIRTR